MLKAFTERSLGAENIVLIKNGMGPTELFMLFGFVMMSVRGSDVMLLKRTRKSRLMKT